MKINPETPFDSKKYRNDLSLELKKLRAGEDKEKAGKILKNLNTSQWDVEASLKYKTAKEIHRLDLEKYKDATQNIEEPRFKLIINNILERFKSDQDTFVRSDIMLIKNNFCVAVIEKIHTSPTSLSFNVRNTNDVQQAILMVDNDLSYGFSKFDIVSQTQHTSDAEGYYEYKLKPLENIDLTAKKILKIVDFNKLENGSFNVAVVLNDGTEKEISVLLNDKLSVDQIEEIESKKIRNMEKEIKLEKKFSSGA